jgi:uncharacterized protein (TIGR02145 family)
MKFLDLKRRNWFLIFIVTSILMMVISVCKKKIDTPDVNVNPGCPKIPVTATSVFYLTKTSATVSWDIHLPEECSHVLETGLFWGISQNPETTGEKVLGSIAPDISTSGISTSDFLTISGLNPRTEYFVRAYVKNDGGTSFGEQVSFRTLNENTPAVNTNDVTSVTNSTAVCGGSVTSDGGFPITEYGVYWGTSQHPETTGTKLQAAVGDSLFSLNLSGLTSEAQYFVTAYATNSSGTSFGTEKQFITYGTVKDIDGNTYNTIMLKTENIAYFWMKENLRTTRYNDGTAIPLITDSLEWSSSSGDGYCWYNNDMASYKDKFGALYNFKASSMHVSNYLNSHQICPVGWANGGDYNDLRYFFLDNNLEEGGKLKSITGWVSPNTGATNETGFSALPGGYRDGFSGKYYGMGSEAYFSDPTLNWPTGMENYAFRLSYNRSFIDYYHNGSTDGYSIRCSKRFYLKHRF